MPGTITRVFEACEGSETVVKLREDFKLLKLVEIFTPVEVFQSFRTCESKSSETYKSFETCKSGGSFESSERFEMFWNAFLSLSKRFI